MAHYAKALQHSENMAKTGHNGLFSSFRSLAGHGDGRKAPTVHGWPYDSVHTMLSGDDDDHFTKELPFDVYILPNRGLPEREEDRY